MDKRRVIFILLIFSVIAIFGPTFPVLPAKKQFAVVMLVVLAILATRLVPDLERLRRTKLAALARKLNLRFNPDNDFKLAERYSFLNRLRQGDSRYAFNVLNGDHEGHQVFVFDYHFAGYCEGGGKAHVQHYYSSAFILELDACFPELTIVRESWRTRFTNAIDSSDVVFESAEFSQAFYVRSKDKKFAYDVCNAQMMEYLLANQNLSIENENNALALAFDSWLSPKDLELNLAHLREIRLRLPDYLFTRV